MIRHRIKFIIAIVFLAITSMFALFFYDNISIFYEFVIPIIFVYFIFDSLSVLIPSVNKYIPSSKHLKRNYVERLGYNKTNLDKIKRKNNLLAFITFILYFGILSIIGLIYLNYDIFKEIHIYLIFLLINIGDYVCVLYWCPFRSIILKNNCCHTCRITNWDRLMKFYILIFIPNIYTLTLVSLGVIIFITWEYVHHISPERFYSISNDTLSCKSCNDTLCKKKKE